MSRSGAGVWGWFSAPPTGQGLDQALAGPPRVPVVTAATIRRTAAPSPTNRRNRPWGPGRLQDHRVLSGGVLDHRGDDVVGHHSGIQLGAGRNRSHPPQGRRRAALAG
jgi:hypothetical protein